MKLRRGSEGKGVWAEALPLTLRKQLHSAGAVCMLSDLALGQFHRGRRVLGRGRIREEIS